MVRFLSIFIALFSLQAGAAFQAGTVPSISLCGGALVVDGGNSQGWFELAFGGGPGAAHSNPLIKKGSNTGYQITANKALICGCIHYTSGAGGWVGQLDYNDSSCGTPGTGTADGSLVNPVYQSGLAASGTNGIYGVVTGYTEYDAATYWGVPSAATGKFPCFDWSQANVLGGYVMCREQ